jgi:hypothetical protein
MSRDSDVDLLILETAPADARAASVLVADRLRGLGYPFDVRDGQVDDSGW